MPDTAQRLPAPDPAADADPAALDVRPIAGRIGAEIHGLDIAQPLDDATVAAIRAALLRFRVVFFRDQRLDHPTQIAFARRFGELTYAHPHDEEPPDGFPEIYTVDTRRFDARYGNGGNGGKDSRKDRHRPTVLLVTHDVDEAIILADRVMVLDDGRIGVDLAIDLPHPRSYRHHDLSDQRDQLLTALGVQDDLATASTPTRPCALSWPPADRQPIAATNES